MMPRKRMWQLLVRPEMLKRKGTFIGGEEHFQKDSIIRNIQNEDSSGAHKTHIHMCTHTYTPHTYFKFDPNCHLEEKITTSRYQIWSGRVTQYKTWSQYFMWLISSGSWSICPTVVALRKQVRDIWSLSGQEALAVILEYSQVRNTLL